MVRGGKPDKAKAGDISSTHSAEFTRTSFFSALYKVSRKPISKQKVRTAKRAPEG
jgi:hypothetical protein